jgi:hypothetical protein
MTYFQELDAWLGQTLPPRDDESEVDWFERVTKAVKAKVLESYRNGQASPRQEPRKETETKPSGRKFWPRNKRQG